MRESVKWFAEGMEQVLKLHDEEKGPHGWNAMQKVADITSLWRHLQREVQEAEAELDKAMTREFNADLTVKELVDIANMAMMVAENVNCGLKPIFVEQFKQP